MKNSIALVAFTLAAGLTLSACSEASDSNESTHSPESTSTAEHAEGHGAHEDMAHQHPEDGGTPPAGIQEAANPTYPVGSEVILTADHMPGMDGATATISGAFDTTTYSVSYTPTNGDAPVTDHRWVVHEELVDPGEAPLADGAKAVMTAEHMPGMKDAEATIDYSTQETVYMVDIDNDEMTMKNHKWVTESEIEPAQ
ncbi:YdhK family protein [Corynebacterium sp.]|uniref:YdhK family protein n=1 Tax=Corynebacterium sp. TaxID=1720 RepID=UPI0028B1D4A4|nr:YdhK family protein [Corynebacterium sp.]